MSNQYSQSNQPPYLLLTLFLILLSAAAYAGLNWLKSQPESQPSPATTQSPNPTLPAKALATAGPTQTPLPTVSFDNPRPTIDDLSPTPTFHNFTSPADNFSVTYSSSRKIYQDTEDNGISRYTFYRNDSNFAIHVGREIWSWEHPNRDFSGNFLVSGQNTFRFQTDGQTIIDIDYRGTKYTIRCIHGDQSAIISECDNFIKSFKLN